MQEQIKEDNPPAELEPNSELQTIEEVKDDDKTNHNKSEHLSPGREDEKFLQISNYFDENEQNMVEENGID